MKLFKIIAILTMLLSCSDPAAMSDRSGWPGGGETKNGSKKGGSDNSSGQTEGVPGYYLDRIENARNRCEFVEIASDIYDVICRLVIAQPDGSEVRALDVAPEIDIKFDKPIIANGNVSIDQCKNGKFAQSCRVSDVTTIAEILFILKARNKKTKDERTEETSVLLPYSVRGALGLVLFHSSDYQTTADKEDGLSLDSENDDYFGLQVQTLESNNTPISDGSICMNEMGLFHSVKGHVFHTRNGKTRKFAGSFNIFENELDSRLRLNLANKTVNSAKIFCGKEAVYVEQRKFYGAKEDRLLKLTSDIKVEVAFKDVKNLVENESVVGFTKTTDGRLFAATNKGRLGYIASEDGKDLDVIHTPGHFPEGSVNVDFIASTNRKKIMLGRTGSVFEVSDRTYLKSFELPNNSELLFIDGENAVYLYDGAFYSYRIGSVSEPDLSTPWRPSLNMDQVTPDDLRFRDPNSGLMFFYLEGTFVNENDFYLTSPTGVYKLGQDAFIKVMGESDNESTNPKAVVANSFVNLDFGGPRDEIYFRGSSQTKTNRSETIGKVAHDSNKVEYLNGSLNGSVRSNLGSGVIWYMLYQVDDQGYSYGVLTELIDLDGNDTKRNVAFKFRDNQRTDLYVSQISDEQAFHPYSVFLDANEQPYVVRSNESETKIKIEIMRVDSDETLTRIFYRETDKEYGSSDPNYFYPRPHSFTMGVDGSLYALGNHALAKATLDSTTGTYGDYVVISGKGPVGRGHDIIEDHIGEHISWEELGPISDGGKVVLDSQSNIYVKGFKHLFFLRDSDGSVQVLFGHQRPQECASGIVKGFTKEVDFAESFRSGFSAFCAGDVLQSFAVSDQCAENGRYRVAISSGYFGGTASILLAERGCPDN